MLVAFTSGSLLSSMSEMNVSDFSFFLAGKNVQQRWEEVSATHPESAEERTQQFPGVSEARVQTAQGATERSKYAGFLPTVQRSILLELALSQCYSFLWFDTDISVKEAYRAYLWLSQILTPDTIPKCSFPVKEDTRRWFYWNIFIVWRATKKFCVKLHYWKKRLTSCYSSIATCCSVNCRHLFFWFFLADISLKSLFE